MEDRGSKLAEQNVPPAVLDYSTPSTIHDPRSTIFSTLGWAVYLGMSWTWCIGMFLPVLLIRDYGYWAWVVFAVPNVVGAAAMGWVLRDGQSERLVEHHRRAIGTFSVITATFQIFFALWMFHARDMNGSAWLTLLFAAAFFLASGTGSKRAIGASVIVLAISLWSAARGNEEAQLDIPLHLLSEPFPRELLWLFAVCAFGFGLCPYLDRTFHHARQNMPATSVRAGFSIGFGVFFFAMIFLTLEYAWIVEAWLGNSPDLPTKYVEWIGLFWMIQLALTIAFHWRAPASSWRRISLTTAIACLIWYLMRFFHYGSMETGELIYRLFMSFYGLVFPAYVWLCMIPTWKSPAAPTRAMWITFAAAVLLAAPFYWMAFIEGRMVWVIGGVAIVLLGGLVHWVRGPRGARII